jgi:hypothetical protein
MKHFDKIVKYLDLEVSREESKISGFKDKMNDKIDKRKSILMNAGEKEAQTAALISASYSTTMNAINTGADQDEDGRSAQSAPSGHSGNSFDDNERDI